MNQMTPPPPATDLNRAVHMLPALAIGPGGGVVIANGPELRCFATAKNGQQGPASEALAVLQEKPHMMVNAPMCLARLGLSSTTAQYDLLELFAFARPAAFLVPTMGALARIMEIPLPDATSGPAPDSASGAAGTAIEQLRQMAAGLLDEVASDNYHFRKGAMAAAGILSRAGWPWAELVLEALRQGKTPRGPEGLEMPGEWRDTPWRRGREDGSVAAEDALLRLRQMLGEGAETRLSQEEYTAACCAAFQNGGASDAGAKEGSDKTAVSLLEAGTGIGKTLGYIAPASLWAEKSGGVVWLSTYTRNLQRQLEQELSRLYPDPADRARRAVVRKGRENYLCLLNMEESLVRAGQRSPGQNQEILLGLILRWLPYSRDGDMAGGDFPRWLTASSGQGAGPATLLDLTDRRGECIHAACPHFKRCFIERAVRKSRSAHLVVANHALVLTSLARGGDKTLVPRRLVFDEGHHLFEAADSAFSFVISGREGAEMRRWILGAERSGGGRSSDRSRGLASRISELTFEDREAGEYLDAAIHAASCLPGPGWRGRLQKTQPKGSGEEFLIALRQQVLEQAPPSRHTMESLAEVPDERLRVAADEFGRALGDLAGAMRGLARRLQAMLDEIEAEDEVPQDPRASAAIRGLDHRSEILATWRNMLGQIIGDARELAAGNHTSPAKYIDWLAVSKSDGREMDYGLHRHWLDPTIPLAEHVIEPADGVIVTSATLRDQVQAAEAAETTETQDAEQGDANWQNAESRVGGHHLVEPPRRASFTSPFDYASQTRVFVVTDVDKRSLADVAAAYSALFLASGGGALGIFTAIERLKAVHRKISRPLAEAELPLLAQHVDPMDTGTLVDIFRAEEHACLLGTDAVRDGIDVPGRALRLIVFDRVPWPRPTILHKARRAHFGGRGYDESLTRLRLKQAFGRLVRSRDDHGIFVILDVATPTRLLSAFPPGVVVERLPLAEVIAKTGEFLVKAPVSG